jgi:hypothetical protein
MKLANMDKFNFIDETANNQDDLDVKDNTDVLIDELFDSLV